MRALMTRACFGLVALTIFSLSAVLLHAQESSTSSVVGHITDTTGAVVPGAKITITNTATNAERSTTTNESGEYTIPNLQPAHYQIKVEKEGFKTSSTAFDLLVGKTADESVALNVGSTSETVEVTSVSQQLQTTEASVGQVIDQKQISDLPLNGRNVLQLATLSAGVSPAQFANTGTPGQFGNRQLYITVDGGRASSTNYVLDGVYVRSLRFNNLSIQPSVDTLQEFNLLRSSFGVEYGQGQAVVSMVTKSGSNQIHGTAFEYVRDSIFDARNYFSTYSSTPHKPVYHRSQFGATLGGPIIKDKIFLFGGYEGLRSAQSLPFQGLFPTASDLGTPTTQFAKELQRSFPVPNCTTCGSNNYSIVAIQPDNYDQAVVRADQTLSAKNSLFERYVYYNASQTVPGVQNATSYPQIGHNVSIGDTYLVTPTLVNEVRLGFNRSYGFTSIVNPIPGENWTANAGLMNLGANTNPSEYGRPSITISGYTDPITGKAVSGYTNIGEGGNSQGDTENIYSAGDTVSDVIGHHTMRFGFQFQYRQVIQVDDTASRGSFTFGPTFSADGKTVLYTPLQNYQRGFCAQCQGSAGTSLGHYTDQTYGVFFNDVWQLGHGLTFNYGIRWEYVSPFVEKDNLAGMFDPALGQIAFHVVPTALLASLPVSLQPDFSTAANHFPATLVQPFRKGFGPRVGVAYQVAPTTVIRGGFGIYFDNTNTNELQFQRNVPPFYYNASLNNQFLQNMIPPLSQLPGLPAPFSLYPDNRSPYTEEWTASVQQELGHGTIFELSYTGSESHKLWKRYDQNEDAFAAVGGAPGARPYQNFLHGMLTSRNEAGSNFQGLSAKLEQRAHNGLFYLINYQWSKNLDNNSGEADSNDTSYSTHFSFDRSYSNFDSPHRAVGSAGYELPFGKNKHWLTHGVGNAIAGGWQVQPIIQLRAGYPFSVTGGSGSCACGQYVPQRVNLAPGRTSGKIAHRTPAHYFDSTAYVVPQSVTGSSSVYLNGASGYQGTVTRNSLRGPGTAEVDFSAIKNFAIFERLTAQFRAEAFNIINHPNYGNPNANISNGNVGTITGTSMDNRDLQFALKLLW